MTKIVHLMTVSGQNWAG